MTAIFSTVLHALASLAGLAWTDLETTWAWLGSHLWVVFGFSVVVTVLANAHIRYVSKG